MGVPLPSDPVNLWPSVAFVRKYLRVMDPLPVTIHLPKTVLVSGI